MLVLLTMMMMVVGGKFAHRLLAAGVCVCIYAPASRVAVLLRTLLALLFAFFHDSFVLMTMMTTAMAPGDSFVPTGTT